MRLGKFTFLQSATCNTLISKEESICKETGEVIKLGKLSDTVAKHLKRADRHEVTLFGRKTLLNIENYMGVKKTVKNGYIQNHRVCNCGHHGSSKSVVIMKSVEHKTASYTGLYKCGNAKLCPECGHKIAIRRANEMREIMEEAKKRNLHISLVTITVPHNLGDKLNILLLLFLCNR